MFLLSTNFCLSFRCVPVSSNETCRGVVIGLESYAIDVAQTKQNIAFINSLRNARSVVLAMGSDIDPSCITILNWLICIYTLPPCSDTKLISPCNDTREEILKFLATCYNAVEEFVDDQTVKDYFQYYFFQTYYDGYSEDHFVESPCVNLG